jgi:hypothetical protein
LNHALCAFSSTRQSFCLPRPKAKTRGDLHISNTRLTLRDLHAGLPLSVNHDKNSIKFNATHKHLNDLRLLLSYCFA